MPFLPFWDGAIQFDAFLKNQCDWQGACLSLISRAKIFHEDKLTVRVQNISPCTLQELEVFFTAEKRSLGEDRSDTDSIFYRAPDAASISANITRVCARYNATMQELYDTEKETEGYLGSETQTKHIVGFQASRLEAIVLLAKQVDLIHPFSDGNTRTAIILLQSELVHHGFLPSIIKDPNTIEVLSINDFITQQLLPGMQWTLELSNNPHACIGGYRYLGKASQENADDEAVLSETKKIVRVSEQGIFSEDDLDVKQRSSFIYKKMD